MKDAAFPILQYLVVCRIVHRKLALYFLVFQSLKSEEDGSRIGACYLINGMLGNRMPGSAFCGLENQIREDIRLTSGMLVLE